MNNKFLSRALSAVTGRSALVTAAGHCASDPAALNYAQSSMTFLLVLRKIHKKIIVFELSNNEEQNNCCHFADAAWF